MRREFGVLLLAATVLAVAVTFGVGVVRAQQATSTNYYVDEAFFGTGGQLCDPGVSGFSTNYCADMTAGDTAVGESTTAASNGVVAGSNTSRPEYLELTVNSSSTNLGALSPGVAATTTGTFSVKAYVAQGYNVLNASDPPRNNNATPYTLTNLTTPTAWNTANEQFGINLVANTSPATFGAAAAQTPDSTFGFGAAATGYNTANLFKYVKGDAIASSSKSSGTTNYTVSYMYNINGRTDAGRYTFNHEMVVLATY